MTDLIPSNDRQIRGANIFLEKNYKGITGKNPAKYCVKYFWHVLKVTDKSHTHCRFLFCRFSWNFVLKVTRCVFFISYSPLKQKKK